MRLITETSMNDVSVIQETSGEKKSLFIQGIFAQGGCKNKNGRLYNPDMLDRVVEAYRASHIDTKRAIGELGHPPTPSINADRACHLIVDLKREGNNFIGRSKILESLPMGQIVRGLLDEGVKIGVSTRGMGSLKEGKNESGTFMEVGNDYKLVTVDVVTDPSGPQCFVNGVYEGAEWIFDPKYGWKTVQVAEQMRTFIRKARRREVEEAKLRILDQFITEACSKAPRR